MYVPIERERMTLAHIVMAAMVVLLLILIPVAIYQGYQIYTWRKLYNAPTLEANIIQYLPWREPTHAIYQFVIDDEKYADRFELRRGRWNWGGTITVAYLPENPEIHTPASMIDLKLEPYYIGIVAVLVLIAGLLCGIVYYFFALHKGKIKYRD